MNYDVNFAVSLINNAKVLIKCGLQIPIISDVNQFCLQNN